MVKSQSVDEVPTVPMSDDVAIAKRWLDGIIKLAEKGRSRDQAARILATYNELIEHSLPKMAFLICLTDPEVNSSDAERTRLTMLYESTWKALDRSGAFSLKCHTSEKQIANGSSEAINRISVCGFIEALGDLVDALDRDDTPCIEPWRDFNLFFSRYFETCLADGGHFQRAFSSAKRRYSALGTYKKYVIVPFMKRIVRSKAQSLKGLIWAIEILLKHRRTSFM